MSTTINCNQDCDNCTKIVTLSAEMIKKSKIEIEMDKFFASVWEIMALEDAMKKEYDSGTSWIWLMMKEF